MRILMLAPQPFYEDRGTPIGTRRVIEALAANGHTVDLLTFPVGEAVDLEGLTIIRIGQRLPIKHIPIGYSAKKLVLDAFLVPKAITRLRQYPYACIHALEEAALPALILSRMFKVPLLYDMQSALPEQLEQHWLLGTKPIQRVLKFFERILVRDADQIACSGGLKSRIREISTHVPVHEWHYPSDNLHPSPDLDDHLLKALKLPEHRYVVLYAGNFENYQGLNVLAEAIPLVLSKLPQARFVFVGAQPADRLNNLATEVAHAVRVIPRQPHSKVAQFYGIADVLISPRASLGNLPLKVLEYMAVGKPIVASDCAAHRTVLDETSALLVAQTPNAIANAIIKLHAQPEMANALGQSARAFALETLGWTRFVGDVKRLYEDVARRA